MKEAVDLDSQSRRAGSHHDQRKSKRGFLKHKFNYDELGQS